MTHTLTTVAHFTVLSLTKAVGLSADLSFIPEIIERQLLKGQRSFALSFTDDSFLYSHHIAVLIKCMELVRESGAELYVINPNSDIRELLEYLDPSGALRTVENSTELEKLPPLTAQPNQLHR